MRDMKLHDPVEKISLDWDVIITQHHFLTDLSCPPLQPKTVIALKQ